jgi:hypothetical protein
MQHQDRDWTAALLEDAASAGSSSEELAALVVKAFGGIDQALSPIVGPRGLAALYKRSLHLARPAHPWLPAVAEHAESTIDTAALTAALTQRTAAEAASAGAQLLDTFRALLSALIGESLTDRLLGPVWATVFSGTSARKASP